jgi:hypothetical protein
MGSSNNGGGAGIRSRAVVSVVWSCWCLFLLGNYGHGCEAFVAQRHPTGLFVRGVVGRRSGESVSPVKQQWRSLSLRRTLNDEEERRSNDIIDKRVEMTSRRGVLQSAATAAVTWVAWGDESLAAVGRLPELSDPNTNAVLQGVTVSVADLSQQEAMIQFLTQGFSFQMLRQQTTDSVTDTVRTRTQQCHGLHNTVRVVTMECTHPFPLFRSCMHVIICLWV